MQFSTGPKSRMGKKVKEDKKAPPDDVVSGDFCFIKPYDCFPFQIHDFEDVQF